LEHEEDGVRGSSSKREDRERGGRGGREKKVETRQAHKRGGGRFAKKG